jgi:hypothetical protein
MRRSMKNASRSPGKVPAFMTVDLPECYRSRWMRRYRVFSDRLGDGSEGELHHGFGPAESGLMM